MRDRKVGPAAGFMTIHRHLTASAAAVLVNQERAVDDVPGEPIQGVERAGRGTGLVVGVAAPGDLDAAGRPRRCAPFLCGCAARVLARPDRRQDVEHGVLHDRHKRGRDRFRGRTPSARAVRTVSIQLRRRCVRAVGGGQRRDLWDGDIPLWNPYQAAGAPHAANMQSAVFDPLNIVVNVHPTPRTWDLTLIGTFVLGAIFTYIFAVCIGMGYLAGDRGRDSLLVVGLFLAATQTTDSCGRSCTFR